MAQSWKGVPMDGTWHNHKARLCLCSLTQTSVQVLALLPPPWVEGGCPPFFRLFYFFATTTTDFLGAFGQISAASVPLFITSKSALPAPSLGCKSQVPQMAAEKGHRSPLQHSQRHSAPTVQQITLTNGFISIQNSILKDLVK